MLQNTTWEVQYLSKYRWPPTIFNLTQTFSHAKNVPSGPAKVYNNLGLKTAMEMHWYQFPTSSNPRMKTPGASIMFTSPEFPSGLLRLKRNGISKTNNLRTFAEDLRKFVLGDIFFGCRHFTFDNTFLTFGDITAHNMPWTYPIIAPCIGHVLQATHPIHLKGTSIALIPP